MRKSDPSAASLYPSAGSELALSEAKGQVIGLTEVTLAYTPPTLTGNTGVSADGFDLRKAATTYVWDAGAFDGAHAITQTGFVQTRVDTRNSGHRMFGLSNVDGDVSFCSLRHAWFLQKGGGLWVYENCAAVYTATITYGVNDQIRIEVEGGYVRYKIQPGGGGGWQTLYTSTLPVTAPLYLDTAFLTLGSTLKDIRFVSGSTGAVSVNRTYYMFGGARVAMREGAGAALVYLHGDHLGSASLATSMTGTVLSQQRYKPYGEVRWSSGAGMPTDLTFTSQRAGSANYVGSLTDYVARFYSPALGRFISADTIVPGAGNPQAFNRYMYVLGNPLRYTDPTGHFCWPCLLVFFAGVATSLTSDVTDSRIVKGERRGDEELSWLGPALMVAGAGGQALFPAIATHCAQGKCQIAGQVAANVTKAACADGDCTNESNASAQAANAAAQSVAKLTPELEKAQELARGALERTRPDKIASQLMSKQKIFGAPKGNPEDLSNPYVQNGMSVIQEVLDRPDRIIRATFRGDEIVEYIRNGIGVQIRVDNGTLNSVFLRGIEEMQKLESFVDNGTATWLK